MSIIACGVNHKTASIDLRERLVFASDKLSLYLQDLLNTADIEEAVILSTCNRSEVYYQSKSHADLMPWFCQHHQLSSTLLKPAWYCYYNREAILHMMKVACGLDSMILGEPEILGQMKSAFSESCAAGTVGPQFNRLFQQIFAVSKEIRTRTAIGACPVSIASAAVNLAKKVYAKPIKQANILLIGAGETIQLVLKHLCAHEVKQIVIANRQLESVLHFWSKGILLTELKHQLAEFDIIISATQSPDPILTKEMFEPRAHPWIAIDIAVPRDIAPNVAELAHVNLFSIDDLKNIIQQNRQGREHAANKALEMIEQKSKEFITWLQSGDHVALTIRAYRRQIEEICQQELAKAESHLQLGTNPSRVLNQFAHSLINKLLHHPSVQLRQAGIEGRVELLQLARELFALTD